jgi:cell division protease FtsH
MGPLTFGKREESIFLGKEFARHQDYSETTAVQIDEEIRSFVVGAYNDARGILQDHRDSLEAISRALLEHEVLDGEEITDLIEEYSGIDLRPTEATQEALPKVDENPEPVTDADEAQQSPTDAEEVVDRT